MTRAENSLPANSFIPDQWYVSAMERLIDVVQDLSHARTLEEVMVIVRDAARNLTGADGATFVLRDGDFCYYADENAISPLWKGQRFPSHTCVSGWVMKHGQSVMIEDIFSDMRVPAEVYKVTFVKSLAMVPIRAKDPMGAIGNYWAKTHRATAEEMMILQALADVTSVAMENADLNGKLQEKLRALQESNYELSRFAWVASHDLKSPLRAINNLSQWIEDDMAPVMTFEAKENMQKLRHRVTRMEKLLHDILSYAQIEQKLDQKSGEMVTGQTILNDILALIILPNDFTLTASQAFLDLKIYRMPIQQILYNLVNNAIKHHDRKEGHIEIDMRETDRAYIFTVTDDGPGIPLEYQDKIFEMFQTLRPRDLEEGSGMGLSMVKKTLTVNGGDITVESIPGQRGSCFRFTWPKKSPKMELSK